jgi:hypothetical protein
MASLAPGHFWPAAVMGFVTAAVIGAGVVFWLYKAQIWPFQPAQPAQAAQAAKPAQPQQHPFLGVWLDSNNPRDEYHVAWDANNIRLLATRLRDNYVFHITPVDRMGIAR